MRVDLVNLSEVLDQAAPGRKLVAEIKSAIKSRQLRQHPAENIGFEVTVDGTRYKVLPKKDLDAKP